MKFRNILETVGNTPMVRLNRISGKGAAEIYAKLEMFNPGGSVKDRIGIGMIEDAERNGLLGKESVIVEPTSGNTGIGLAIAASVKGYRVIFVLPENFSIERQKILRVFGAELVLTPKETGMAGAVEKAEELVKSNRNYFMPQQFRNPANPEIHRKTTAKEILKDLPDLDVFVAGIGTGGTLTGVGEVLKSKNPGIKVVAVEPADSPVLSGGKPGQHKIQGIGAGFVPEVMNREIVDEIIQVGNLEAIETAKRLAKEEGIFAGISSGAAAFAALKIAGKIGADKKIVVILPDTGERYLSTELGEV
ncbi:MAG: cysteine synthase A [Candidatus Diapherotrites archaeon]